MCGSAHKTYRVSPDGVCIQVVIVKRATKTSWGSKTRPLESEGVVHGIS